MKRGDRWMAAVTMAGAAMLIAGALIQQQRQYNEGRPLEAEIVLDGRVVETLPLTGPPREIKVDSAGTARGFNIIRAERGGIAVVSADCPDGACVRQGWIRRAGAGTVCLPHRLVVRIKGADRQVDGGSW